VESLGIQLYPLPECDDDEDDDYKQQCQQLKVTFNVIIYSLLLLCSFSGLSGNPS